MRLLLALLTCLLGAHGSFSDVPSTDCMDNRQHLLELDYSRFDQDMTNGWRAIAEREGCKPAAADLLRDYHAILRTKGEPVIWEADGMQAHISEDGEVGSLYWHEGQLRAFAGQTEQAVNLFRKSLKPAHQNYRGWNQYALGSIAFLEGDHAALKAQRDKLAARFPDSINIRVLDRMMVCFGKPYSHAYGSAECQPE